MTSPHQPYDSSMKALLKEDTADILARLLLGATLIESLDTERLPPTKRVDGVHRIRYRNQPHIFHLEFQAGPDEAMAYLMNAYHGELLLEYRQPVISMIVYLFEGAIAESPLKETSGEEEILTFHFRVLPLWTMDGRQIVQENAMSMYTLLPAMKNVDAEVLLKAINEMVQYYGDDETKLGRRFLWLKLFLRRATMISPEDKEKVEQRLDAFDQLLEEDEFVQQQRALGREEGKVEGREEGKEEGKVEDAQQILVKIVSLRFPSLKDLAQKKAEHTGNIDTLHDLIELMATASDEDRARWVLSPTSAA